VILWFTILQLALALSAGVLCVVLGLIGKKPADITLGSLVLIELLLIAQLILAIVQPLVGNPPTGNPLEFWLYLVGALIIPPLAVLWASLERTRWSTVVLGVGALSVAVMLYRMQQIWTVQLA
jgi:RsiW-degrading membrane proteinase PrsW (M82 family)